MTQQEQGSSDATGLDGGRDEPFTSVTITKPDIEVEPKRGLKRKEEADDTTIDQPRRWGDRVREPRPKIPDNDKIMGKRAGSYTIHEMRRILQHFGRADSVCLNARKDDLLQALVDLCAEVGISAKDRCWILRQPLGPGAIRYQPLDRAGQPTVDSFPEGRAPKSRAKRQKTSSRPVQPPKPKKTVSGLPQFTGSISMPVVGPGYAANSTASAPSHAFKMSKGKQPVEAGSYGAPGNTSLNMSLKNALHEVLAPVLAEIEEVKRMASASQAASNFNAAFFDRQFGGGRFPPSPFPPYSSEHAEQGVDNSPALVPEKSLEGLQEIEDSEESESELDDDDDNGDHDE